MDISIASILVLDGLTNGAIYALLGLATVLVGDDPASAVYVGQKVKTCEANGIRSVHVPLSAKIMNDEPFGPIAVFRPFDDIDAVLAQANTLPYGLAAYVHTADVTRALRVARRLEAGVVTINAFPVMSPTTNSFGLVQ